MQTTHSRPEPACVRAPVPQAAAGRSPPGGRRARGGASALFAAACAALLLAIATLTPSAWAAPGSLDPTFNGTGKRVTRIGTDSDTAHAVAVQTDGRIVVAGSSWTGSQYAFALVRYTPDGAPDPTFGNGGVAMAAGGGVGTAWAMAIQGDGKILVGGSGYDGVHGLFAVARFLPDGRLDAGFGTGGVTTTALGVSDAQAYAIAVAPDGRIVAAGYANGAKGEIFGVARYNADGSLDKTFNGTGTATAALGTLESMAQAVLVQPDGKIVAAGWGSNGPGAPFFAAIRYNIDGSRDLGFGTTGIVTESLGVTYSQAWAAALQPDGKIVIAGDSWVNSGGVFSVVRYNANGSLDSGFNGHGYVMTPVQANAGINAVTIQPNGKIVVAGSSGATSSGHPWVLALARYNANGTLDTGFGTNGIVNTAIGASSDYVTGLAIQHDGKIVAAGGSAISEFVNTFFVARYLADPLPAATVVEFYNADLDNYFITADPVEQAFVDSGAVGRWTRTGQTFKAGGVALVCRFGGNPASNPATGLFFGPNSHFYTADAAECAQLKGLFDAHAKSWHFESNDFAITPATGGCGAGTSQVYRAYNNGFTRGIDSNHRFTTSATEYQKMIAQGWAGEGPVFCATP